MGLLSRLFGTATGPRTLESDLREAWEGEMGLALLLRDHAERARYPQIAARLRDLADVEERHAGWLGDAIRELGGALPVVQGFSAAGESPWERACAARHRAQRKRRRLVELLTRRDPADAAIARLLRRIAREDAAGLAVLEDVVVRSDPHARD